MYSKSKYFNELNLVKFAGKEGFWLDTGEHHPAFLEKDKINNKIDEIFFDIFISPTPKIRLLSKDQLDYFYFNKFEEIFTSSVSVWDFKDIFYKNILKLDTNKEVILVKNIISITNDQISIENTVINGPYRYSYDKVRLDRTLKYYSYQSSYGWSIESFSDKETEEIYNEIKYLKEKK